MSAGGAENPILTVPEGEIPYWDGCYLAVKAYGWAGARMDEESTAISCGRFSLTYYSFFRMFNSS